MKIRNFKIIATFLIAVLVIDLPTFADEAADKAEFKKLYAEFNELYANSEDIKPIIEVGIKLYEIAPEAYGKYHMNTAVVTYNLASLYDEAGGTQMNSSERTATELYKQYFKILDRLKTPKDETYLEQYTAFVIAEFNSKYFTSNHKFAEKALDIAYSLNLTNLEIADFEYLIAYQRFITKNHEKAFHHFTKAKDYYILEYGENHAKVGRSIQYIAAINQKENNFIASEKNYLKAIEIYQKIDPKNDKMIIDAYLDLSRLYWIQEKIDEIDELKLKVSISLDSPEEIPYLPIERANPRYPSVAAENGIEGWTLVCFTVTADGKTENVVVLESSHKMFEKNSVKAAKKYRYVPRKENGKRVPVHDVKVRIEYKLAS